MTRFKYLSWVAVLTAGTLFSDSATARATDWDREAYRDRHEAREQCRERGRDRDPRCFRRLWDPHRGWVAVPFSPPANGWERHDNDRHRNSYRHEDRAWHHRDDD